MSGTIADKLNLLISTKASIKQAIINKGASISDSDTFASYAEKIDALPQAEGSDTYEADLALLGVVDGLPQPDEETVIDDAVTILQAI